MVSGRIGEGRRSAIMRRQPGRGREQKNEPVVPFSSAAVGNFHPALDIYVSVRMYPFG